MAGSQQTHAAVTSSRAGLSCTLSLVAMASDWLQLDGEGQSLRGRICSKELRGMDKAQGWGAVGLHQQ